MRGRRRPGAGIIGLICLFLGAFILLAVIMPSGFWWVAFGAALIIFGIAALKSC